MQTTATTMFGPLTAMTSSPLIPAGPVFCASLHLTDVQASPPRCSHQITSLLFLTYNLVAASSPHPYTCALCVQLAFLNSCPRGENIKLL